MSALDIKSRQTCDKLAAALGIESGDPVAVPGTVPIGIEIEVKFSSYFPDLWKEFDLEKRGFGGLSKAESDSFSAKCSELEKDLLPKLRSTILAGVPRGNDRYWEFALDPAHDVSLLVEQVELMSEGGVLPRDRRHSLQVTVGDLRATPDVYYLAMLLELQTVDAERIAYGIEQTSKTIYTGWARKGRSGVFEKGADDLKHGSTVACELRPLQLPVDRAGLHRLMLDVSWAANAIAFKQGVRPLHDAEGLDRWNSFVEQAKQALYDHGLPDRNWGAGQDIDRGSWIAFGEKLQDLHDMLIPSPKRRFQP